VFIVSKGSFVNFNAISEGGEGFPHDSVGKESTCNAGDTGDSGLVPGLGRSLGGGYGNPQYSCLGSPMDRETWWATYSPWGPKELDTTERLSTHTQRMVRLASCCEN